MIIKFEQYNESIKSLLVGPTNEEIWIPLINGDLKGLLNSIPNSPEDFFLKMKDDCELIDENEKYYYYGKNNHILFAKNKKGYNLLVCYKYIWMYLRDIYGLNEEEIKLHIKKALIDDIKWKGFTPIVTRFIDKKSENFNESIKSLLVGPSEKEMWIELMKDGKLDGFIDSIPNSPEDFFLKMKEGCEKTILSNDNYYYVKNGKILFAVIDNKNWLAVSTKYIWSYFEKVYGLNKEEIQQLIMNIEKGTKWDGLLPVPAGFTDREL